eukprot:420236_1
MSMFYEFIIAFILKRTEATYCNSNNYQSSFWCKWEVDDYTLDLTAFQMNGMNLTGQDINYKYWFSPCNNLIYGPNKYEKEMGYYQMAVQYNKDEINYLAKVNGTWIEPEINFNSNNKITWTFKYSPTFSWMYICVDQDAIQSYMEITDILEITPGNFMIQISSYFVCQDVEVPPDLFMDQCIWYDEYNSSTLDLSPLYGKHFDLNQGSKGNVHYQICSNGLYDRYEYKTHNYVCGMYWYEDYFWENGYISPWNYSVQPILNISTYSWIFEYEYVTLEWICDTQVTYAKIIYQSRSFAQITSQYACSAHECIFYDPDNNENTLDLTYLQGQYVKYIDQDLQYGWEYAICQNDVGCDDIDVMAMRWNIYQRKCDPYLALWEGKNGYNITYNKSNKEWKFVYKNGELCSNQPEMFVEFNLYWKCNVTGTNWTVTNVESINDCIYAMYVSSKYAC